MITTNYCTQIACEEWYKKWEIAIIYIYKKNTVPNKGFEKLLKNHKEDAYEE
jgi:hypothetical protein